MNLDELIESFSVDDQAALTRSLAFDDEDLPTMLRRQLAKAIKVQHSVERTERLVSNEQNYNYAKLLVRTAENSELSWLGRQLLPDQTIMGREVARLMLLRMSDEGILLHSSARRKPSS